MAKNLNSSNEEFLRELSNENTAKTFAFNSQEASKSRNWEKMMSDTSHQREVEDLKRAGLNPVLSANGGASSYSASSASGTADSSAVGVLASLYQTKMNNDNAIKIAQMSNENNKEIAQMSNANSKEIANIQAAASNYASNQASSASKYASDQARQSSKYASDNSLYGTQYSSDNSLYGTQYGVDRSKYGLIDNFVSGILGGNNNSNSSSSLASKLVKNASKKIINNVKKSNKSNKSNKSTKKVKSNVKKGSSVVSSIAKSIFKK